MKRIATFVDPKILIVSDDYNGRAREFASFLKAFVSDTPNMIVVLGGDGTMLHAIQAHWQKRLPFVGINLGHRGFLLTEVEKSALIDTFRKPFWIYSSPLLFVETRNLKGETREGLAFNDAWVRCGAPSRAAWIEVSIDGVVRIPKAMGDGMLVATAAGSTSYARAMGAHPIPIDTPMLVVAGSNLMEPPGWKAAYLPLESVIRFRSVDPTPFPKKRPLLGFVDGVEHGEVIEMIARVHPDASIELAFPEGYDIASKLTAIQFPV